MQHPPNRKNVDMTFYCEGARYTLPLHLAPQSSVMLDIKNIVEANAPDAAGNVFPAGTTEGSVTFESADGPMEQMNVVISGAVFNVVTGTCGICCVPCCGTTDVLLDPTSDACSVGDTQQFDGSTFQVTGGNWSSSNTSVATVNSSGLMSAVGSGTSVLTFTARLPASSDCGQPLPGE